MRLRARQEAANDDSDAKARRLRRTLADEQRESAHDFAVDSAKVAQLPEPLLHHRRQGGLVLAAIYALIGLVALLFAAFAAAAWKLISKTEENGDLRVSLSFAEASLDTSRANEETAVRIARDATELVDAIRASNAHNREAQDDVDTEKIKKAGNAAELVTAGASVWQSMPTRYVKATSDGKSDAVQPAAATDGNSARGKR